MSGESDFDVSVAVAIVSVLVFVFVFVWPREIVVLWAVCCCVLGFRSGLLVLFAP